VFEQEKKQEKKNTDIVNTTGMDQDRMLFCDQHHPMDEKAHNILPGE
jgi:hypothetical protein